MMARRLILRGGMRLGRFGFARSRFGSGFCSFGPSRREEPTRQAARKAARHASGPGCSHGESARRARRSLFARCGFAAGLLFGNGGSLWRSDGLVAILCERFAGQKNRFFGEICRRRTGTARAFLTTIVITALLAAAIVVAAEFTALR